MSAIEIVFQGRKLTPSEFNEIEKSVLGYFNSLWNEVRESMEILRRNNPKLIKSEICLIFIGADSLSRFGEIVTTGLEGKNNENRFREWFDYFVFNDRNEVYKKHKKEIDCNSSTAWKLRNSLLHFYGLPKSETEYLAFAAFNPEFLRKLKAFVSQNHQGKRARVVSPYRLIEAILSGFLTQLQTLSEMIKDNDEMKKEIYARGIVKCFEIIQHEGAVYASFEKR